MEKDADKEGGGHLAAIPSMPLLCVRKQLWPTEDYITY